MYLFLYKLFSSTLLRCSNFYTQELELIIVYPKACLTVKYLDFDFVALLKHN